MYRTKILVGKCWEVVKATFGRTRYGEKNGQAGRSFDLVQRMFGLCETENGTEIDELLQVGASGHKRARQDVKTNSGSGRWQRKKRPLTEFEMGGFMAQEGLERKMLQDIGALPKEEGDVIRDNRAIHEENFQSS